MEIKNSVLEDNLLNTVMEIINNSFCPSCKKYSTNIECDNCKEENKKLKLLYKDLDLIIFKLKSLKQENNKTNLILNGLKKNNINYNFTIDEIDSNSFINKIVDKINNNEILLDEEKMILSILLKTKQIKNEVINNFVILNCLNNKNFFDVDTVGSVISLLAENMFESKKIDLKCKIEHFSNIKGKSENNFIYLNKKEVEKFILGDMDVLFTLFHEYIHVLQYYRQIVLQLSSVNDIKQIKEKIIKKYNPKFFENSIYLNSTEKETNILGNTYLIKYLDSIGFPIISLDDIKRIVNNNDVYVDNVYRIVSEDSILIDNEFNKIVKLIDYKNYPQLNFEYKIEDSKVILKDLDEIYSDIEYVNKSTKYNSQDKKNLLEIYKDIIYRQALNKKKN